MDIQKLIIEKKPNLSQTTIKKYIGFINKLHKSITGNDNIKDIKFLNDKDKVDKYLNTLQPANKKNYYTIILILLNENTDLYKSYENDKKQNNYDLVQKKQNKDVVNSETQQDKVIDMSEYDKLIDLLKDKDEYYQEYIMFSILKHYPIRNEIGSFKYYTLKEFNKIKDKNDNYLVIGTKTMFMFRTKYKTHKNYGDLKTIIEDKNLKKIINRYIIYLLHNRNLKQGDNLFVNTNGNPYTNDTLSLRLANVSNKFIGVKLSTSSIFKILLANKEGNIKDNTDYIIDMSKIRPTDPSTIIQNYVYLVKQKK